MSVEAVHWALYDAPMPLTEKGKPDSTARYVLVVLADHADADGTNSYPSPLRVRWATGLDERTVTRAIARLQAAGLIVYDGVSRYGTKRWALALNRRRGDTFEHHLEAAEQVRRVESERRQARRDRAAIEAVSGTQSPGQPTAVRDAESRRPGVSVPASGTQDPDVRDAAPPEPPVEPSENHQDPGGTLPPDPLRRDDPQAGRLNDPATSPFDGGPAQSFRELDHSPARASPKPAKCPHGLPNHTRSDRTPTCFACRRGLPSGKDPPWPTTAPAS
ncbi:helix-turn-helix domain-containing protein [Amycolatopsis sp. NPDC049688]|uniref:helix-turn-helix domain-containing protein n=1 Tax=Amycolatopsis sp. NPDC049688 TaxID=3154733 RepID=UPI003445C8EA